MTSKNLKSAIWLTLAVGATALAVGGSAYGKGGPPDGKGNKPTTEATNNLSVPAIMAGGKGAFTALVCGDLSDEDPGNDNWPVIKEPLNAPVHYPYTCAETHDGEVCVDEGFYYVQRQDTWQAPCMVVDSIEAEGAWGDNLAGDAMLKVGSPIRVELVLWASAGNGNGQPGYKVIKLEPSELDRESDYGHLADGGLEGPWSPHEYTVGAEDAPFGTIVHDPDATLTIQRVDDDGNPVGEPVFDGPAGGEINATGKIVYGYNLRVNTAGTYLITYTVPNVTLSGCDAGECGGTTATLPIEVVGGGGGGGNKPPRP